MQGKIKTQIAIAAAILFVGFSVGFLKWRELTITNERLCFALNVKRLPEGTRIVGHAEDIWTDYVVHFVVRIPAGKISEFMSGRDWVRLTSRPHPASRQGYTEGLPTFIVYHEYILRGGYNGLSIQTDEQETTAYVLHMAD